MPLLCAYPLYAEDLCPLELPEAFILTHRDDLPPELPEDDAMPQVFAIDDEDTEFGADFEPDAAPKPLINPDEIVDDGSDPRDFDFDFDFDEDFEEELDDEYGLGEFEATKENLADQDDDRDDTEEEEIDINEEEFE